MRRLMLIATLALCACGPANRDRSAECVGAECSVGSAGECTPGAMRACYTGDASTIDVGACHGGTQTCTAGALWGDCTGQVTPISEVCSNGVDDNCNGEVDEDVDLDGDGQTTCGGDCCDSVTECGNPAAVNSGAFDVAGDGVDNDCDGVVDNGAALCDSGIASNTGNAMDFARAMDLCQTASANGTRWGVIDAKLTLADGTGVPDPKELSVRPRFGTNTLPQVGASMAVISTGAAAAKNDVNPSYHDFVSYLGQKTSGFPADFLAANGGTLPNAPGCPGPLGTTANDPVMLTLEVRVPTNAHSFSIQSNFFSAEFPEFTCSAYNDFFVMLLDSQYAGMPANPADKNLAFYQPMGSTNKYPVGVNLAHGDTGLFTQCMNGATGCNGTDGTITTCTSQSELVATGFDDAEPYSCDANSLKGGATGWLTTTGNVVPGETITLRIAIWDTSDHAYDSLALIDGFQWSADPSTPGTVIFRRH